MQAIEVRHVPGRAAREQKRAAPLPGPSQSQAAGLGAAGASPAALLPARMGWENGESGRGEACEHQQRGTGQAVAESLQAANRCAV